MDWPMFWLVLRDRLGDALVKMAGIAFTALFAWLARR